jgi:ATP-dependent helicase HrpB
VERALDAGRPLIVTAPTGSGKSTRLPLWLAERAARVLVIEPRRVACRALATWVAGDGRVGDEVGYRVRFEDRSSSSTRILFVTPGVALRMIADGLEGDWAVLVDELHERGAQVDLCVALLRARRASRAFPLVFTSATLEVESLQRTLEAELVEASGRTFPVDVKCRGAGAPSGRDLEERVADAALDALAAEGGDVLVFLPGKGEIDAARRALSERTDAELAVVHAQLPPAELQRALGKRPKGHRRVFLSTNVAETSLTIPSVRTVVDSGLVRTRIHRAGRSALALIPCARDQLDQRAGRAGRVTAGTAVRLFAAGWTPKPETAPEVSRTELDDLVLQAAACGLGSGFEDAPWITPPPSFAVERARSRLRALGALDDAGDLTDRGRTLARAPVSAEHAALLAGVGELEPVLASALCDLVALMDSAGSLELHPPTEEARDARAEIAEPDEVRQGLRYLQDGDARRHGLHRGRLEGARRLARTLRELTGVRRASGLPAGEALAECVARRLPSAAFALRERVEKKRNKRRSDVAPYGNSEGVELDLWTFSAWDRELGAPEPEPPKTGFVLAHAWTEDHKGRVRGRGRLFLPCAPGVLADAGVGEVERAAPRVARGRVVADREVRLGGRLIARDEAPLTGPALLRAAAALVLEGRLIKGARDRVLDDLHVAGVARALDIETAVDAGIALDDPAAFVEARLAQLGVQEADDLALVEVEDLGLTLGAAHLDPTELERLREDFPRTWTLHGATYDVVVRASRRLVELAPGNAQAKKAQEPRKDLVPRFRGFRVEYVKGSRRVRLR